MDKYHQNCPNKDKEIYGGDELFNNFVQLARYRQKLITGPVKIKEDLTETEIEL